MLNNFRKMVEKICERNNINCKLLSKNWVIMLEKNNKIRFITGCKFSLNNHAIGEVLDDKYALYEVLKENKIPIIEHNILYPSNNINDYALGANDSKLVKDYFLKNNNNIVLKPCKGTCGHDVYHVTSIDNIDETLENLFLINTSVSYCPFYNIKNEYRIIVLDGNIEIIYKKQRPIVEGNGKDSIRNLLLKFNYSYFNGKLDDEIYDIILDAGKTYEYDWKFNLSNGAVASFDVDSAIKGKMEMIVKDIINKLELKFVSIDIVETDEELLVLEINSGVMMENLINMVDDIKVIENVYEKSILLMFEE